jgi:hypothetical protein
MRTYIYKELIAEAFTSIGKNNINHPDIIKAFGIDKTGHYCEIYKEDWGFSVHLYGKGFMNGYYPTIVDITEQKDVKALRTKIKTVFSSNGVYTVLANPLPTKAQEIEKILKPLKGRDIGKPLNGEW